VLSRRSGVPAPEQRKVLRTPMSGSRWRAGADPDSWGHRCHCGPSTRTPGPKRCGAN